MSSLSLERLLFDPADANNSPNVGAYLRADDGTLITHTGAALDINIASSDIDIQVDLDLTSLVADDAADSTENPLKIGFRAHDAASALGAVSADGDKANAISDLYRRQFINDAPNISANAEAVSVGLTEVALPTTALAGRTRMMIQNSGEKSIYVGPTGVSTSSGLEVTKGGTLSLEIGEGVSLFAISDTASQDVRVFELA